MQIGNARYNCSCCVRYVMSDQIWMIASLSGGSGLLLIIVIIIIIIILDTCRRRRRANKPADQGRNNYIEELTEMDEDDMNYCSIPEPAAAAENNEYSHAGPVEPGDNREYSALGEPEPDYTPPQTPTTTVATSPYYLSLQGDYAR